MEFLNQLLFFDISILPFVLLVLLISFTIHEFAHAYVAYKFGDPTAKELGRVTLNPQAHLDFFGLIVFLLAGFGWAKPVPVNRQLFKKPRLMGVVVSAVGPLSNLLLACLGFFIMHLLNYFSMDTWMSTNSFDAIDTFFRSFIGINILLFVFNLIPLPPLDGYRIIEDLVPNNIRAKMSKFEPYSIYIFLLLVLIPQLRMVTIQPILDLQMDVHYILERFFAFIF
ncbi:site-2 protease family protein [Chengkuizengella axinellae]|uniref:Site-2 protease family protein n=1 Tax=Chengkuizengella axinellae TaxID=3064388 RepID=A0ABT9IWB6_9BACL|nr:site-2 protease family protein [Chengkuizengella sp. 2205SS18-9]MDP5273075.1 site-2 protease family protein [Chengkuizengella sp. 2205SS18-9]